MTSSGVGDAPSALSGVSAGRVKRSMPVPTARNGFSPASEPGLWLRLRRSEIRRTEHGLAATSGESPGLVITPPADLGTGRSRHDPK
jgi:hypothetical protein